MAQCAPSTSARPTLPPLHTLGLPIGKAGTRLPHIDELYDAYDLNHQTSHSHISHKYPQSRQTRKVSISSSTSSRTPSPTPSISPLRATRPNLPHPTLIQKATKIRLVPTTLEDADAIVFVPPQTASLPGASATTPVSQNQQPLLLVGPALAHLRHPQRQLAKGARIHPYRIVRGPADSRRASTVSTTSS
ncbi:hypothetical protein BJ138DRAFT_1178154 [Hygrophoropsis aurantiaca]|uniref:Uncharacterized protein n=1 Tax=Hygrophoropsis aurantiaca TaxID=72124 RepID=A0ACB8AJ79_9AGAM|nr:hypothetical protein BJ138DRAFT_1178154 [Hygrophoropsis aurantiaca]